MKRKYQTFLAEPEQDINDYITEQLSKKKEDFYVITEDTERAIRQLPEYKLWVLRHKESVDKCQVCGTEFNKKVKPEVHHTPLTLYEIVINAISELESTGQDVTTLNIIKVVIDWHNDEKIGSLTICPCCHKQAHYEREEFGEEVTINAILNGKKEGGEGCNNEPNF